MATLHVRNVPDDLYELLRDRAVANDRSIGAETVRLLHERLVGAGDLPRPFAIPGMRRRPGASSICCSARSRSTYRSQPHWRRSG
jgi:plasmid stability protein